MDRPEQCYRALSPTRHLTLGGGAGRADDPSTGTRRARPTTIVARTFSKAFGLALERKLLVFLQNSGKKIIEF